jgi:hypothetical protein
VVITEAREWVLSLPSSLRNPFVNLLSSLGVSIRRKPSSMGFTADLPSRTSTHIGAIELWQLRRFVRRRVRCESATCFPQALHDLSRSRRTSVAGEKRRGQARRGAGSAARSAPRMRRGRRASFRGIARQQHRRSTRCPSKRCRQPSNGPANVSGMNSRAISGAKTFHSK